MSASDPAMDQKIRTVKNSGLLRWLNAKNEVETACCLVHMSGLRMSTFMTCIHCTQDLTKTPTTKRCLQLLPVDSVGAVRTAPRKHPHSSCGLISNSNVWKNWTVNSLLCLWVRSSSIEVVELLMMLRERSVGYLVFIYLATVWSNKLKQTTVQSLFFTVARFDFEHREWLVFLDFPNAFVGHVIFYTGGNGCAKSTGHNLEGGLWLAQEWKLRRGST